MRLRKAGSAKARQRKELDDLHRIVVMLRHKAFAVPTQGGKYGWMGNCLKCGKERWLQVSHIAPKGQYPGCRHDPENAFALCFYCHLHWWHKNPEAAREFGVEIMGKIAWDRLWLRARAGKYLSGYETTKHFLWNEATRMADAYTIERLMAGRMEGSNDGV